MTKRGRKRLLILVAGVVLLGAGAFGFRQFRSMQRERVAVENRAEALRLYEAGEYAEALPRLGRAVRRDQTDPDVLYAFADSRWRVETARNTHLAESLRYFQAVLFPGDELDPARREEGLQHMVRIARFGVPTTAPDLLRAAEALIDDYAGLQDDEILQLLGQLALAGIADEVLTETSERLLQDEAVAASVRQLETMVGRTLESPWREATVINQARVVRTPEDIRARETVLTALVGAEVAGQAVLEVVRAWRAEFDADRQQDDALRTLEAVAQMQLGRVEDAVDVIAPAVADDAEPAGLAARDDATLQYMTTVLRRMMAEGGTDDAQVGRLQAQADATVDRANREHPDAPWAWDAIIRRDFFATGPVDALARLDAVPAEIRERSPDCARWALLLTYLSQDDTEAIAAAADRLRAFATDDESDTTGTMAAAWADFIVALHAARSGGRVSDVATEDDAPAAETLDPVRTGLNQVVRAGVVEGVSSDRAIALWLVGVLDHALGDPASAIELYEEAKNLAPGWATLAASRTTAYIQTDRLRSAMRLVANPREWGIRRLDPRRISLMIESLVAMGPAGANIAITLPVDGEEIRFENRLQMAEALFSLSPWDPEVTGLYASVLVADDGLDAARQFAADALEVDDLGAPTYARLADFVGRDDPVRRRLLERAAAGELPPAQRALVDGELARLNGDLDRAVAILQDADGAGGPMLAWRAARLLIGSGRPEGEEAARAAILELQSPNDISTVAEDRAVWEFEALARLAVERLESVAGPRSSRVLLAKARLMLEFGGTDEVTGEPLEEQQATSQALTLIEDALVVAENDPTALRMKADLLIDRLSDQDRASIDRGIALLDQVTRLNPADIETRVRLVRMLHRQGEWERARQLVDEYLQTLPRRASIAEDFADLLEEQGRVREAIEILAVVPDLSARGRMKDASLRERIGDDAGAASRVAALESDPNLPVFVMPDVARFIGRSRSFEEARGWLAERAETLGEPARSTLIALAFTELGDPQTALDAALGLLEVDPTNGAALGLALSALNDVDLDEAERSSRAQALIVRHLEKATDSPYLQAGLAAVVTEEILAAVPAEVREGFRDVLGAEASARRFERLRRSLAEARARIQAGEPAAVPPADLEEADALVREYDWIALAHQLAIEYRLVAGDPNGAVAAAMTAMRRFPDQREFAEIATRTALQIGRTTAAVESAEQYASLAPPDDLVALEMLAAAYLADDRPRRARATLEPHVADIRGEATREADGVTGRPVARLTLGAWLRALASTDDRRLDSEARLALSARALAPGDVAQAVTRGPRDIVPGLLDAVAEALPDTAQRSAYMATRWLAYGRLHGDVAALERVQSLLDEVAGNTDLEASIRGTRAQLATYRGDFETAIAEYEVLKSTADDAIRAALDKDPALDVNAIRDPLVLNNLASVLAMSDQDCSRAVELATQAFDAASAQFERMGLDGTPAAATNMAFIRTTLAMALACNDDAEAAVLEASRAMDLDDTSPMVVATFGWARLLSGDRGAATQLARQAQRIIDDSRFPAEYVEATRMIERIESGVALGG